RLSAEYLSYDMADERQHVAYGRKWLPQLMAQHGITMPVEQFITETVRLWEAEDRSGALPLHQAALEEPRTENQPTTNDEANGQYVLRFRRVWKEIYGPDQPGRLRVPGARAALATGLGLLRRWSRR